MYPLYWTSSKEGIFMRYSYEYKRKCVEMYRKGLYPDTPEGIGTERFRNKIREWVRIEEACGPDALRHSLAFRGASAMITASWKHSSED